MSVKRLLAAALLAGSLLSCKPQTYLSGEGFAFGSTYHMTYAASEDLQKGIDDLLIKFNQSLSHYDSSSTISRFNRWGTEAFDLSKDPWMERVIRRSLEISELSDGGFDITVAPLVNLWGFGNTSAGNPSQTVIDSIKAFVGYKHIRLSGHLLYKDDPRVQLDCSALAVGFASDLVAEYLKEHGSHDYMVEIGGELAISGKNPKGERWRIGINKPVDDSTSSNHELQQVVKLTDCGLATSGNYRSFYIKDGKKYAHTIDPVSGYPVQHNLLSATIVAKDGMDSDALATVCMVLGMDKAEKIIQSLPGTEAYFIYNEGGSDNKIRYTKGFKKLLVE